MADAGRSVTKVSQIPGGRADEAVSTVVTTIGRLAEPPWAVDQRHAATTAWAGLG
jgi:hypothetical protein